jgi:hypothetical protein
MNTQYAPRYITVWEFRSVDGKQVAQPTYRLSRFGNRIQRLKPQP